MILQCGLLSFFYGDSSLYSCPDRNGVLCICSRMSHSRADLLSLDVDSVSVEQFFEEFVEGIDYTPPSEIYPGASIITEFYYLSDYPLLIYDIWSNPVPPAGEASYPDRDPEYFSRLINNNAPVTAVPIVKMYWYIDYDAPVVMGCRELLSKLTEIVVDGSGELNSGEFRTFLVDLNQDGQLEYVISHKRKHSEYSDANTFTIILSEQDETVYAYYDEYSTFTDVDSSGNIFVKDNYGIAEGWVYRFFFRKEHNFQLEESIELYTGVKERAK